MKAYISIPNKEEEVKDVVLKNPNDVEDTFEQQVMLIRSLNYVCTEFCRIEDEDKCNKCPICTVYEYTNWVF